MQNFIQTFCYLDHLLKRVFGGSDDGLIHVTTDNGESWQNVTPPPTLSPKLNMINCIDPSPFKKGTAYVAATSYKFGDINPISIRQMIMVKLGL